MSVPATYAEPKGIFLLEAMANGVPVVQPRHGAFPEILETTGGGLLVTPTIRTRWPTGCSTLWTDPARADALGRGRRSRRTRALHRRTDGRDGRADLPRGIAVHGEVTL